MHQLPARHAAPARVGKAYRTLGLEIVGIHSPEFAFEKSAGNLQAAISQEKIAYPVGPDNNLATWTAYRNQYWPAKCVSSAKGSQARLNFQAAKVYHVLSGEGTVTVSIPGEADKTIKVSGTPNGYQLVDKPGPERKTMTLTLTYSPGVSAFTFTFG